MASPTIGRSDAATYLTSIQPPPVRERLVHSKAFCERFGVGVDTSVSYRNGPTVSRAALHAVASAVLSGSGPREVPPRKGPSLTCSARGDGALVLSFRSQDGQTVEFAPTTLLLLSVERERRLGALARMAGEIGPTHPDGERWRLRLKEGPLTSEELEAYESELGDSVPVRMQAVRDDFEAGRVRLNALVPASLGYWERLLGDAPGPMAERGPWLRSVFARRCRGLVSGDPRRGAELCLAMGIRAGVLPPDLLEGVPEPELAQVFSSVCEAARDPFSLLGVVELGSRAPGIGDAAGGPVERAAALLSGVPAAEGVNPYEPFSSLLGLFLAQLRVVPAIAGRPPWWRRLCAFTQAALVAREASAAGVPMAEFAEACSALTPAAGAAAALLDMRAEPLWWPGDPDARGVRALAVGRLLAFAERERAEAREVRWRAAAEAALADVSASAGPAAHLLPGPLEADGPPGPVEVGPWELRDEVAALQELLRERPDGAWTLLADLGRLVRLGQETIADLAEVLDDLGGTVEESATLNGLAAAAGLAAAQRSPALAEAVLRAALRAAGRVGSGDAAQTLCQAGTAATAAWAEEAQARERLEAYSVELASRLPRGEACAVLAEWLRWLQSASGPAEWPHLSRAMALAELGGTP